MEPIVKVVYPTPPPTTNNLSLKQRSLLLRKTKKIEQILGYPPHLIDPLYTLDDTTTSSPFAVSSSEGRSSIESSSSTLVCLDSSENKDGVSWFCYPHGSRSSATGHKNGLSQIPLLRVTSKSLRLELSAVTNWPAKSNATRTTPAPNSDLTLRSSLTDSVIATPTFTIPSSHTHRKAKMDRVRKRLGPEVPYEVVFPEDAGRSSDSSGKQQRTMKSDRPDLSPAAPSTSSPKHFESRLPPSLVNIAPADVEKLSLIPECSDENAEDMVDFPRTKERATGRRDTVGSRLSMCTQSCDGHGQGVTMVRRPTSYRKPPPPMLDASLCSF